MRLRYVEVEHYKHLEQFILEFRDLDEQINPAAYRFFIGKNGSGKSAAIEAISLIFTRAMQDETPGFRFKVKYTIEVNGVQTEVTVSNNPDLDSDYCAAFISGCFVEVQEDKDCRSKLMVTVNDEVNGQRRLPLHERPFSQCREYHPKRIVAQSSGPTTILEDILIQSTEMSLKSDLYDVREGAFTSKEYNERAKEISSIESKLKLLKDESPFLFVDSENAVFVMIALCACLPFSHPPEQYCQLRSKLFGVVGQVQPASFSLIIDEEALDELRDREDTLTSPERFFLHLIASDG